MSQAARAVPDQELAAAYLRLRAQPLVITLDGPAGAGKSTIAARLSTALAIPRLDSGAIYRTLALAALEGGVALDDEAALTALADRLDIHTQMEAGAPTRVWLAGREVTATIRSDEVSRAASEVSVHPSVRAALLPMQRAAAAGGVVAEGRDMGSVVFPAAALKVFLTADPLARGTRRLRELAARQGGAGLDVQAAGSRPDDQRDANPVATAAPGPNSAESHLPAGDASLEATALQRVVAELADRDARDSQRVAAPLVAPEGCVMVDTSALSIDEVQEVVMAAVRALVG